MLQPYTHIQEAQAKDKKAYQPKKGSVTVQKGYIVAQDLPQTAETGL